MAIKSFEDLTVWQDAIGLMKTLHEEFNKSKDYWIKDQLFRACLSISNNIAEGFERESKKEYIRFLFIAKASCGEVRSMLYVVRKLQMKDSDLIIEIIQETNVISKKLLRLIQAIQSKM